MKIEEEKPSFMWYLWAPVLIMILASLHFVVCLALAVVYWGDEKKCRSVYEYYSPWGWGKRKQE